MKADRNANKVLSAQELAMAECREAAKELQNLTREMKRMTRAHDFAGFDAQRERSNAARARVSAAMLAVVRSSNRDAQSDGGASETPLNEFVGSNA